MFSFNYTIYDLLAISNYYLGNYDDAITFSELAIEMEPNDNRLKENHNIYLTKKETL